MSVTSRSAIKFLKDCQITHKVWAEFFEEYPEEESKTGELVGTKKEHIKLVKQYQKVINLLERKFNG